ncbi:MAG: MFS transporter [Gammaproteobacteria bacterium]|nr:MFS transporter [Gammaproteobacteria bacterium]
MKAVFFPLSVLLAVQVVISLAVGTVPLYAVSAAPDMNVDLGMVGFFTAITYFASTVSAPYGGGIAQRLGGVRASQVCLFFAGTGIGLTAIGWPPLFILSALFLGVGLGQATPASSHILVDKTPPALLPLVFSIRMTGVPGGNLFAGLLIPLLILLFGWRGSAVGVAMLCFLFLLCIHPLKPRFDTELFTRKDGQSIDRASFLGPIKLVLASAPLRILSIASFLYCGAQLALTAYLAVYYVEVGQMSLVDAGLAVSVAYGFGVVVRVLVTGFVVHWIRPLIIFGLLGWGIALSCLVLTQLNESWSMFWVLLLSAFMGASAMSWNGLFLSEVAHYAPQDKAAVATGGALSFAYFGAMVIPVLYGLGLSASGSYQPGFYALAGLTGIGGAMVLNVALRKRVN